MATILSTLKNVTVGNIFIQQGSTTNGIPDHSLNIGTYFIDDYDGSVWVYASTGWSKKNKVAYGNIFTINQSATMNLLATPGGDGWNNILSTYTWTTSALLGLTHETNGKLTISSGYAGTYMCILTASLYGETGSNYGIGIAKNDVILGRRAQSYAYIATGINQITSFSCHDILSLVDNDNISIKVKTSVNTSDSILINSSLTLIKLQ